MITTDDDEESATEQYAGLKQHSMESGINR